MVQAGIQERLEAHEQEPIRIKKELSTIPVMEEKLMSILKNMESIIALNEKTHQMMLLFRESAAKERSSASDKIAKSSTMNSKEGEGSSSKGIIDEVREKMTEGRAPTKRNENEERTKKIETEGKVSY